MEGVSQLASGLFGLRLEIEPALPGEVWHSDVIKVSVYADEPQVAEEGKWVHPWEVRYPIGPGVKIGTIYCDFFHRPGKMSVVSYYVFLIFLLLLSPFYPKFSCQLMCRTGFSFMLLDK